MITQPPAQASDEPMRAAMAQAQKLRGMAKGPAAIMYSYGALMTAAADTIERLATKPSATADVERDAARYRWLRERPYSDWKRIAFNTMDDHPFAIKCRDEEIDAAIAATKGAKP